MSVLALGMRSHDVVTRSASEHNQIKQRISTQAVGTVYRSRRTFTDRVKAIDDVGLLAVPASHLTVIVTRDTAHLVMDGWHHWNRLFSGVDVGKLVSDF